MNELKLQDRARLALEDFTRLTEHNSVGFIRKHQNTLSEALRLAADPDWVYVPREPTLAMHEAVLGYKSNLYKHHTTRWKKAIAAAPVATTEGK